MLRTSINVLGDSCVAALTGKSEGESDYYQKSISITLKMNFELSSKFEPKGDQPNAIKGLVDSIQKRTIIRLFGVTGSGKTFTMANVIQELQRPALVISHNKTLAAQLIPNQKPSSPIMQLNTS